MFELASGLLGSLFGGLFRLAPEVFRFFDRKFRNLRTNQLVWTSKPT